MREVAIIIIGLAFISLVGFIIYWFESPWWVLMLLTTPSIFSAIRDEDDDNPDMI